LLIFIMTKTSLWQFHDQKERMNLKTYDALIKLHHTPVRSTYLHIYLISTDKIELRIENGCVGESSLDIVPHDRRCFDRSIIFIRRFMSGKNFLNTLLVSRHLKHLLYT
jgi:hypothetical protein